MVKNVLSVYLILILFPLIIPAQPYVQLNFGLGVGSYNSLALGGNVEYGIKEESKWIKSVSYQHFHHMWKSATDIIPSTETNYQSLIGSIGYEANLFKWTSFTFALGGGITHVYHHQENIVGPTFMAQIQWLVHLGEKTSLILPLYALPRQGQISWIEEGSSNFFYKIELVPVGLRVML